jgi:hypothetical protein
MDKMMDGGREGWKGEEGRRESARERLIHASRFGASRD